MILSDRSLREAIEAGRLVVDPLDDDAIQPSSIDIRLDSRFRVFHNARYPYIDLKQPMQDLTELVEVKPDDAFILHPGEFVLASTLELIGIPPEFAARLEGKALAVDTPVPTPAGWTTMGELRAGDRVFDERGRVCTVLAATGVLEGRPCREIVFCDGQSLLADLEHRWQTCDRHGRRPGGRHPRTVTTAQLAERLCAAHEDDHHHVALAAPVQYPQRPLPVDPYALGLRLGDGTSPQAEATHADAVLGGIERAGGAVGTMRVPSAYLRASVPQRAALLEGLMDGGGQVDARGRCAFTTTVETLADAVVELAASLGYRPVKTKGPATVGGVDRGPRFVVEFTPHRPVFRLPRKLERQRRPGTPPPELRAIVAVREVDSVPVRCIQVSSPSGLFLAGPAFIPTHNSSLGRLGLLTHSTAGFLDPGFTGHVTLELSNVANLPITLYPGMRIGQIAVFQLTTPAERPYGSTGVRSKYQGQRGPTPSRYWENFAER